VSRPRLIGTIENRPAGVGALRRDCFGIATGCTFYPMGGSSGVAHDFRESFGETGPHDIGKRVYNDRGVIVMESIGQRDARLAGEPSA